MTASELFNNMEQSVGSYPDSGVVCDNGKKITNILWEIDWFMLYNVLNDKNTLYVVHHPISNYSLGFSSINKEDEDDPRSDVSNWLLEFRARKLGLNLAVSHTLADIMLENELREYLDNCQGWEIVRKIDDYFDKYYSPHPSLVVNPAAKRALDKNARQQVVVGTYDYKVKQGIVYIDEYGMEKTKRAILISHSLVDMTAMTIWSREASKILSM